MIKEKYPQDHRNDMTSTRFTNVVDEKSRFFVDAWFTHVLGAFLFQSGNFPFSAAAQQNLVKS